MLPIYICVCVRIYINIYVNIYVCVCIYLFIFTCVLQKWFRTSPQNCRRVMWVEPIYNLCAWLPMFENGPMDHIQLWNLDSWSWTWSEWPNFVAKYVAKLCEIHFPLLRLAQCCSLRYSAPFACQPRATRTVKKLFGNMLPYGLTTVPLTRGCGQSCICECIWFCEPTSLNVPPLLFSN